MALLTQGCATLEGGMLQVENLHPFSKASLKRIKMPTKCLIDEISFSPDSKEMVASVIIWHKRIPGYGKDQHGKDYYTIYEIFPKYRKVSFSPEEGDKKFSNWRTMSEENLGIVMVEPTRIGNHTNYYPGVMKKEYWLYKIEKNRWSKLNWTEGGKLFKQYKEQEITPDYKTLVLVHEKAIWTKDKDSGQPSLRLTPQLKHKPCCLKISPDKSKILYRTDWKVSTFMGGWFYYRAIGVCSTEEGGNKLFKRNDYDEKLGQNVMEWAPDSRFAILFDDAYQKLYKLSYQ